MKKIALKKITLCVSLAIIFVLLCVSPAFAASQYDWVIDYDGQIITYNGKTYKAVDGIEEYVYILNKGYSYLEFDDTAAKKRYDGSTVNFSNDGEYHVIKATLHDSVNGGYYDRIFVEESYIEKFKQIQSGNADYYTVFNNYGITDDIKASDYKAWCDETGISVYASNIQSYGDYLQISLYSNTGDGVMYQTGLVLKSKSNGKFYLINYSEYDSSYFYADGTLTSSGDKQITVYPLNDKELENQINTLLEERPDDELDWVVGAGPSETFGIVTAIIFFGVVPAAIVGFCVIMLIKAKKKMYRWPLILFMSSAVLVMIAALFAYII